MKAKTVAIMCAAAVCGAAFASEEEESTGWEYSPGEGVSFNEQPIVSGEATLNFDSKYLSYGLVFNNDPVLKPEGSLTFFDWVEFGVEAYFDITRYGRRAGYTSRAWQCTELYPIVSIVHKFSPDDCEWLPTTVEFAICYQYEYIPNVRYRGGENQGDDTHYCEFKFGLPDLWFEPFLYYERDIMRDNGTYVNFEIGHTFPIVEDGEEGADPVLSFRPSIGQGFGNAMRVRAYLAHDGEPLDHSGLMDTMVKGELTWKVCDFCSLSGYVAYSDFLFDRKIRDASREYEATGSWDHSWNFIAGLALTLSF